MGENSVSLPDSGLWSVPCGVEARSFNSSLGCLVFQRRNVDGDSWFIGPPEASIVAAASTTTIACTTTTSSAANLLCHWEERVCRVPVGVHDVRGRVGYIAKSVRGLRAREMSRVSRRAELAFILHVAGHESVGRGTWRGFGAGERSKSRGGVGDSVPTPRDALRRLTRQADLVEMLEKDANPLMIDVLTKMTPLLKGWHTLQEPHGGARPLKCYELMFDHDFVPFGNQQLEMHKKCEEFVKAFPWELGGCWLICFYTLKPQLCCYDCCLLCFSEVHEYTVLKRRDEMIRIVVCLCRVGDFACAGWRALYQDAKDPGVGSRVFFSFGWNFRGRYQTWGRRVEWWRRCWEGQGCREWKFGARFVYLLKIVKVSQLFQELATLFDGRRSGISQYVMQPLTHDRGVEMALVGGLIHFVDPRGRYESGWHGVHDRTFARDGVKNVSNMWGRTACMLTAKGT